MSAIFISMQAGVPNVPHYLYPARISFSPRALSASPRIGNATEKPKDASGGGLN